MPTAEEIRQFNRDVRVTLRLVCKRLEINASQFGVLWCDEFGGCELKASGDLDAICIPTRIPVGAVFASQVGIGDLVRGSKVW